MVLIDGKWRCLNEAWKLYAPQFSLLAAHRRCPFLIDCVPFPHCRMSCAVTHCFAVDDVRQAHYNLEKSQKDARMTTLQTRLDAARVRYTEYLVEQID